MKTALVSFLIAIISFSASASYADRDSSDYTRFFNNFNFGLMAVEAGPIFSLDQPNLSNLPNGIGPYMSGIKTTVQAGAFGLSLYFRDLIGIEGIMYIADFRSTEVPFKQYMADTYPNNFYPNQFLSYRHSIDGFGMRLCYRQHFKHFFIEPKVQFTINTYEMYPIEFTMKENGSNQYIEYSVENEIEGPKNSYAFLLNIAKGFKPWPTRLRLEAGVFAQFTVTPVTQTFTVTEKLYGQPETTYSESIKLFYPSITASVSFKFFIEND